MSSKKKEAVLKPVNQPTVNKKAEAVQKEVVPPTPDVFDKLGKKAPWVALGLLILLCCIVFREYLFGDKSYLFKDIGSDSYNYIYPFLYQLADYMPVYGVPKWSFHFGMGQSLFPFFLRDPFYYILVLMGKDSILGGTVVKEVIKIVLGGWVFFFYLRTMKFSNYTSIIGCVLFAFCGFTIVGSGWQMFAFDSLNLAILLLAFELLFMKRNWYLFPVAILLMGVAMPFNIYMYGLFLAAYAVFRMIETGTFNVKKTGALFGTMIVLGLVGMLISAPFLIENVVQMLESPRGSGTNSLAKILSATPAFQTADANMFGTSMMRLFSSDLIGTGNEFKGWQNFLEAPMFYSGLLTLLLVPQVFQFLEKRVKVLYGVFLFLWVLPIIFPYFRYAFWLFTGDYFRTYCIVVTVILLYFGLRALDMIIARQKVNLAVLIGSLIFLFILLNYPYFPENIAVPSILTFVSFMLIVYAAVLFFIGKGRNIATMKYVLFVAVLLEAMYLSGHTVNDRDPVLISEAKEKKGYNDYTVDALKLIAQKDKSPFYRVDKTYASSPAIHYSLNDALVQGYNGTTEYNPFNQQYFIFYLQLMGVSDKTNEAQSRWATGLSSRPILESQNQVKYMLAKTQTLPLWSVLGDSVGMVGDVKIFRNKFVLPFGYTYSKYIKESAYAPLNNTQKDFVTLQACVVKDEDVKLLSSMKEFNLADTIAPSAFNFDIYRQNVNELSKDTMTVSNFKENDIAGKINVSEDKIVYLSVPNDAGWKLKVDGKLTDKRVLFAGMTGIFLQKGEHTIEMHYDLRYWHTGWLIAIAGILLYLGLWLVQAKLMKKPAANAAA